MCYKHHACPNHPFVRSFVHQGLLDEWTSKGPAVQDLNSEGSALCSLITFLTSPAKTKTPNKSGKHQQCHPRVSESFSGMGSMLFGCTSVYCIITNRWRSRTDLFPTILPGLPCLLHKLCLMSLHQLLLMVVVVVQRAIPT